MNERTADERLAEESAREAEEQARAAEKKAADNREQVTEEEQDEEVADKEAAPRGPIGPWLSRSPASRMALALSVAEVPLIEQLAPYVTAFDWRTDGRFDMELSHSLTFETGEATLAFQDHVSGRAAYDGLTELEGVLHASAEGQGEVERIGAEGEVGPLVLQVAGMVTPIAMKPPTEDPRTRG